MNRDGYSLIVIYRCWSWDHWDEINHEDPEMRDPDVNPGFHAAVLPATWPRHPSDSELLRVLGIADAATDEFMGHAERVSHTIVGAAVIDEMALEGLCEPRMGGAEREGARDARGSDLVPGEWIENVWEGATVDEATAFMAEAARREVTAAPSC